MFEIRYDLFAKLGEKVSHNTDNWKKSIFYKLDTHARAGRKDKFALDLARIANGAEALDGLIAKELDKLINCPNECMYKALLNFVKGMYTKGEDYEG